MSGLPAFALATSLVAFVGASAGEQPGDRGTPSAAAGNTEVLDEVTITARRSELAPKVSKFVDQISAVENQEGLARWQEQGRVCPLVRGLPRQEGEFVLERFSEIARRARVPLAGEGCRPNLFIIVTADPKRLLDRMSNRNRILMFGDEPAPSLVEEFIATPRAVRVWYATNRQSAWGEAIYRSPSLFHPPQVPHSDASRLLNNVVYAFFRVFVIADQTRLRAVTRGQFADYVSMVSLAELKPGARLGDAPSILQLFDGSPQARVAGMSDWDEAFLKSLYTTEQRSKLQRTLIVRSMVREIVP